MPRASDHGNQRVDQGAALLSSPDPASMLDRLHRLHAVARKNVGRLPVELYHRATSFVRIERQPNVPADRIQRGTEDGLAVRLLDEQQRTLFASATGLSEAVLRRTLDAARSGYGVNTVDRDLWPADLERPLHDRQPDPQLPSTEQLRDWLDQACSAGVGVGAQPGRVWVEAAVTVESWIADRDLEASRLRTRAWAVAHSRPTAEGVPSAPPLVAAARQLGALTPRCWSDLAADRHWPEGPTPTEPLGRIPVLFGPEASAALVVALVKALHTSGQSPAQPVGEGWKLDDDPLDPEALIGGTFDDCCFPAKRRTLSDGRRLVGQISGAGNHRRGSYRDPPIPLPSQIVVGFTPVDLPPRAFLAVTVMPHGIDSGGWVLEASGGLMRSGAPAGGLRKVYISAEPAQLARRCVGSVGPARRSYRGVETPALLFEELAVQT